MKRHTFTLLILIQVLLYQAASAQWVPIDGPYGGSITGVVTDNTGVMFAPSGSELLKTSDISSGWDTVRTSPEGHNLILMTQGGVMLVATNTGAIRSFDGGVTWEDASNGLQGKITSINQLPGGRIVCITKPSDNEFYICTTDNTGSNWNSVPHDGGYITSGLATDPVSGYVYFISGLYAGQSTLYRSADGIVWEVTDLFDSLHYLKDFMIDGQGRLYLLYGDNGYPPYFYLERSSDYGETWSYLLLLGEEYPYSVSQIDNGDLIIIMNSMAFRRSVDDGLTWQSANTGVTNMALRAIYEVPGDTVLGQSNEGLYYSPDNGYTWLWGSEGMVVDYIMDMAVSDSGVIIASASGARLWKSPDDGLTWQDITHEIPSGGGDIIFSGSYFWLWYTRNAQYHFARSDGKGQWDELDPPAMPNCFSSREDGDTYLGANGLFKSEDFGDTWTELTGSVIPDLFMRGVKCLNSGTVLCFCGNDPYYIYRSSDNGNTWSKVFEPYLGLNNSIFSIEFHTDGVGHIYTGVGKHYFYNDPAYYYMSNDDGLTWTPVVFPDSLDVVALYTDAANGLYVISDTSIYKSTDKGVSWSPDMEGLPPDAFSYGMIESENSNIYLIRNLSELYKKAVPVSAKALPPPSEAFTIYPNPATNILIIDNSGIRPVKEAVIQLYDISGKCLREYKITSEKTTLDLSGIPPGLYLIKGVGDVRKIVKLQ